MPYQTKTIRAPGGRATVTRARLVGAISRAAITVAGLALGLGLAAPAPATAWTFPTQWDNSPDPFALYGGCLGGGSAMQIKADLIAGSNHGVDNVLAATVLQCGAFGGGGTTVTPCPAGSPYDYCVYTGNDGGGNSITIGVLTLDTKSDPATPYSRCPAGGTPGSKVALLEAAGHDPRTIKGLVTLACGQPTSGGTAVADVPCPAGPSPFSYCVGATNDGGGYSVTLGVVTATGGSDPLGLYGECNAQGAVAPGFLPKMSLVRAVNQNVHRVLGIEIIYCNVPRGFGPIPSVPTLTACAGVTAPVVARRYDYCIFGVDTLGNGVLAGVTIGR